MPTTLEKVRALGAQNEALRKGIEAAVADLAELRAQVAELQKRFPQPRRIR